MARRRFVFRPLVCGQCQIPVTAFVEDGVETRCACGGVLRRPDPIAPQSATVVDDVLWGGPRYLENFGPQPIYCRTKSEYRALLAAHGMETKASHVPVPGTDKSPHTTRWDIGLPPGVDARPFVMLSPAEQQVRRAEAANRFGVTVDELASYGANLASQKVDWPAEPASACDFTPDR